MESNEEQAWQRWLDLMDAAGLIMDSDVKERAKVAYMAGYTDGANDAYDDVP